jgi:ABC-2 type transport system permease protein
MLGRLAAMIVKEMWAVLRDPKGRIILIVPPIMQLIIFGMATTLEVKNVTIGVLDRDGGRASHEFVSRLAGSPTFRKTVVLRSGEEMREAIDQQEVIAVLVLDEEFSADVASGRGAVAQVILDGRRSNAAQIVNGYLGRIAGEVGAQLSPRSLGPSTGGRGEGTIVRNWFNPNLDYLWFTMPALIVMISATMVLVVTGQAVARERELGTFDQLMVSPLRVHEILIGKMVPPILVGLVDTTIFIAAATLIFGVPLQGSLLLLYLSLGVYLLALVGVGMLVSSISQTQQQAFLGMFLVMVPAVLLSGYASPVENMPDWLQTIALANPLTYFLEVAEGIFLKAMPAGEVLASTAPMAVIAAITLTSSALLFRARME